jgi:hypothetical protein
MASPIEILKKSGMKKMEKEEGNEQAIVELIEKAFTTRNLLHFQHWKTQSYAQHGAVGSLYDSIIEDIDEIVEVYQGKFGLITGLCTESCEIPKDITAHVKAEAAWVEANRSNIARGTASIENLVDTLVGHYHKTVYKLENLH